MFFLHGRTAFKIRKYWRCYAERFVVVLAAVKSDAKENANNMGAIALLNWVDLLRHN